MADNQNLDGVNMIFSRIRAALGTLQIQATYGNLDTTLGCMQLCDKGIALVNAEKEARKQCNCKRKELEANGKQDSNVPG